MADIPGIIEGASEGRGLGLRFLRHIERNSLLLFLVPADANSIKKEYEILLGELMRYNPDLLDKQRVLAISKSDLLDDELEEALTKELPSDVPFIFISSFTQKGIIPLKDLLWKELNKQVFHDTESLVRKPMDIQIDDFEDNFDYSFDEDETSEDDWDDDEPDDDYLSV
jgi:GTP-binding protein